MAKLGKITKKEKETESMTELKIAASSQAKSVAGAIAGAIRENQEVVLKVIGAGAVNQATKGVIIANGYLAPNGIRLTVIPAFEDVEVDGESRTMIQMKLYKI